MIEEEFEKTFDSWLGEEAKVSDPFSNPRIDNYCSENEAKVYLTREDIKELGFLRSNPTRNIYGHKDKKGLVLKIEYVKDYSVKDLVVEEITIYHVVKSSGSIIWNILYLSIKPNKEDIQQVINNYAG